MIKLFCIASPILIIKIFDIIKLNKTNPDQNFTSDKICDPKYSLNYALKSP